MKYIPYFISRILYRDICEYLMLIFSNGIHLQE